MLKKFATWVIVFGLSFLVSKVFEWTEQGEAFFYINFCVEVVIILGMSVSAIAGLTARESAGTKITSFLLVLVKTAILEIALFASLGASKLFNVDFFVAYQIMTFGQCLYIENKKKDD